MATQSTPPNQETAVMPPASPAANPAALVAQQSVARPKPEPEPAPETEPELALESTDVAEEGPSLAEEIEARIAGAPLLLEVRLPIRNLRVKDILALEKGKIYETEWPGDEDIPAGCAGVQLVWTEFEVIEKRLAVRVTRLA